MQGKLQLNQECYEIKAHETGAKVTVALGGKEWQVELVPSEEGYHVRMGEHVLHIELTPEHKNQLCLSQHTDIAVDGHLFGVQFHPQRAERTQISADLDEQVEGGVTALMPGTVFRLLVKEGQEVKAGEVLLILEAMKMENEIKAPMAGHVLQLPVSEGTSVTKGQLLALIGTEPSNS